MVVWLRSTSYPLPNLAHEGASKPLVDHAKMMILRFVTSCSARPVTSILKGGRTDFAWYLSESHKTPSLKPLLSVCSSAQKSKLFTTHQIPKVNTHRHMCIVSVIGRIVSKPCTRLATCHGRGHLPVLASVRKRTRNSPQHMPWGADRRLRCPRLDYLVDVGNTRAVVAVTLDCSSIDFRCCVHMIVARVAAVKAHRCG